MACSMESTVSTPKATGTPNSMETWARPLVHSPATYSKCGVPPRMTAPRAMMASYSPCCATFCATSGISKAPGARMMVMSFSLTPWRTSASTAPLTRLSTTKLLKRPTTRAYLPCGAMKVPSMVFRGMVQISYSVKELMDKTGQPYGAARSERRTDKAKAGEAAEFTEVNEQASPVFNAVCPSAVARHPYSAGRYSTTSRSKPDIALNFIGALIRRILRTPRSRRICEPAPTVL